MKSNQFVTILATSLIFICLIIYSCQKERFGHNNANTRNEQSIEDMQLEKRILAFRDQINSWRENPTLKSGGDPWEVDDAIYYIEALANYTYGDASYSREGYSIDSSFITVSLTSGLIPAANLAGIYEKVIDSLAAHQDRITAQEMQLIAVDVSLSEVSAVAAIFKISSGFGTSGGAGWGNDYPWYWGWELGRCDNSGLGEGKDAADKIMEIANICLSVPSGNSYYDSVSINDAIYGCDYIYNEECALFEDYQEDELIHACLSPGDVSFYKNGLMYVGDLLKPSGKSTISYFLEDLTAFPENAWYMVHHAEITYGVWHYNSNPPEEL